MGEGNQGGLWYKLWGHRSLKEKQRLRSLIPYILYGFAVFLWDYLFVDSEYG